MNAESHRARNTVASDSHSGFISPEHHESKARPCQVVSLSARRDARALATKAPVHDRIAQVRQAMKWGPSEFEFEHPLMERARATLTYAYVQVDRFDRGWSADLDGAALEMDGAIAALEGYAARRRHPAGQYAEPMRVVSVDTDEPF